MILTHFNLTTVHVLRRASQSSPYLDMNDGTGLTVQNVSTRNFDLTVLVTALSTRSNEGLECEIFS